MSTIPEKCSETVFILVTESIKSRNCREKAHGFRTLIAACSNGDKADDLINFGIVEAICENTLCLNSKTEKLSLKCIELLSTRLAFYDRGCFETTFRFLKRLAYTTVSQELLVCVLGTLMSMSMFLLERDLLPTVPFRNMIDLLWSVYTGLNYEICGVLKMTEILIELDKDLSNSEEIKTFITKMTVEVLTIYGKDIASIDDNIVDSLGCMIWSFMKRFGQYFQPGDMEVCFEFRKTLNLIFIPFLDKFTQIPSREDADKNIITVAISSVNALFYCPDHPFNVAVAETVFPVSYKLFRVVETCPNFSEQRRLVRHLLSNVMIFLCLKHLTGLETVNPYGYWKEYFAKGFSSVKYTEGCIPKFVKHHAEASWSFVFLHFFRIIYDEKNCLEPLHSYELCDTLGRHILRLSGKGKVMDAVSTKVLWLVLAAQYDKDFFAREEIMIEAVKHLIQNIDMHPMSNVVTEHPSLAIWLLSAEAPKIFKLKTLVYWIEELDFIEVIRNETVIVGLLKDNVSLIFEAIMTIPHNYENYAKYFTVMRMVHAKCDDEFKNHFSSALWDSLCTILRKHSWSRAGDYPILNSYLKLAMQFNCPIEKCGRNISIMDSMLEFIRRNSAGIDPLWLDFVKELLMGCIARSSNLRDTLVSLEMLTIENIVFLYEACLYDTNLFISGTNLIVEVILTSIALKYEYSGKQIQISLRLIGQRLHTNRRLSQTCARFLRALLESRDIRTIAVISPFQRWDARKYFLTIIMELFQEPSSNDLWACLNLFVKACQPMRMDRHIMTSYWVSLLAVQSSSPEIGVCVEEINFWREWTRYSEHMSKKQRVLLGKLTKKYDSVD